MRTTFVAALCAVALLIAACQESPTSTTTNKIGHTTIEEMLTVPAYKAWYDPGYAAYPDASHRTTFDSSVAVIQGAFAPSAHSVLMVVKPNCGCQTTQLWMPRVMKALDAAGVPHANVEVFITDARLTGVDTVETKYNINIQAAPVFLVLRNNTVVGKIDPLLPSDLPLDKQIEQMLAAGFAKP